MHCTFPNAYILRGESLYHFTKYDNGIPYGHVDAETNGDRKRTGRQTEGANCTRHQQIPQRRDGEAIITGDKNYSY